MFDSTLNFFKRIGTIKHKFRLEIIIHKLTMNPEIDQQLNVVVKRGEHKKQTKKVKLCNRVADFRKQRLIFENVTMFYNNQTKKYTQKQGEIRVIITLQNGQKKLAGIIKFDLANYSQKQTSKQQQQLLKCPPNFKSRLTYQVYFKFIGQSFSETGSETKIKSNTTLKKIQDQNPKVQRKKVYTKQELNDFDVDQANNNKLTNEQQQEIKRQIQQKKNKKNQQKQKKKDIPFVKKKTTQFNTPNYDDQQNKANYKMSNEFQDIYEKNFRQNTKKLDYHQNDDFETQLKKRNNISNIVQQKQNNSAQKKDQLMNEYYQQQIKSLEKQVEKLNQQKKSLTLKVETLTQKLRQKQKQLNSILSDKKTTASNQVAEQFQNQIQSLKKQMSDKQKYFGEQLIRLQQNQKIQTQQLKVVRSEYQATKQQLNTLLKQKQLIEKDIQVNKKKNIQNQLKQAQDLIKRYKFQISNAKKIAEQQGDQKLLAFLQKKFN